MAIALCIHLTWLGLGSLINLYRSHMRMRDIAIHHEMLAKSVCRRMQYPSEAKMTTDQVIPRVFFQTYPNKHAIPRRILNHNQRISAGYQYFLWDDDENRCFLMHYFPDYLWSYENLKGAHKADLVRYLFLYQFGGVYIDIKTLALKPLAQLFSKPWLYTVLANSYLVNGWIYQGIIASPPKHTLFLKLAKHMKKTKHMPTYDWAMVDFAQSLIQVTRNQSLFTGLNQGINHNNIYLFQERCQAGSTLGKLKCKSRDWRGLCCYVFDHHGQSVFLNRVHDYPWSNIEMAE